MAPECEIYLYCSCARDATSVRVARELEKENCATKVISGGLKAWIKAGSPLEPVPPGDVEPLPSSTNLVSIFFISMHPFVTQKRGGRHPERRRRISVFHLKPPHISRKRSRVTPLACHCTYPRQ